MRNVSEKRRDRYTVFYNMVYRNAVAILLRDLDVFIVEYIQYRARSDERVSVPTETFRLIECNLDHSIRIGVSFDIRRARISTGYGRDTFGTPQVRFCALARSSASRRITRICIWLAKHSVLIPFPNFTLGFLMLENCIVLFHQILGGQNLIYLSTRRVQRGTEISEKSYY